MSFKPETPLREAIPPDLLELARNTPRISIDDSRVPAVLSGEYAYTQFGNNFYMLWQVIQPDYDGGKAIQEITKDRLSLVAGWTSFSESHTELFSEIAAALEALKPAKKLKDEYTKHLKQGIQDQREGREDTRSALAEQLNAAVQHPLGIDAIGMLAWDNLNPLLEQAAAEMEKADIDPRQFY